MAKPLKAPKKDYTTPYYHIELFNKNRNLEKKDKNGKPKPHITSNRNYLFFKQKISKIRNSRRFSIDRNYEDYNYLFSYFLEKFIGEHLNGKKLAEQIKLIYGDKKLDILDEGAGKGTFLKEFKKELKEFGIISKTYGLSIHGLRDLKKKCRYCNSHKNGRFKIRTK
ncbi:MAG: hypothetical protein V1824_03860 [archaeon]